MSGPRAALYLRLRSIDHALPDRLDHNGRFRRPRERGVAPNIFVHPPGFGLYESAED